VEPDVIGVLLPAAGQASRNSEGQGWHEKVGNSDGDFIMHLSQLSVGMLPL
jgi:hypothetical protein